jgi:hypothetical protein
MFEGCRHTVLYVDWMIGKYTDIKQTIKLPVHNNYSNVSNTNTALAVPRWKIIVWGWVPKGKSEALG